MKHKILWALIGIMVVTALVLAACAPPSNGNGNGNGNGADEPQYGGKMTYWTSEYNMKEFDPLIWANNMLLAQIFDQYFTLPWEKGPAGTSEMPLEDAGVWTKDDWEGELLESFEVVDIYQVNYKLRQGIPYWNKAPVNGREVTVDDIMWNWLRDVYHERSGTSLAADPAGSAAFWQDYLQEIEDGTQPEEVLIDYLAGLREVTPELEEHFWGIEGYDGLEDFHRDEFAASYTLVGDAGYDVSPGIVLMTGYYRKIDDYNLELHACRCNRDLMYSIGNIWPTPPEVTEVDQFANWETVVGTGPWIPVSYDSATQVTFERNPDYWKHDPIHPENQLPYADELQLLVIEDATARYAALETAQLDGLGVEWDRVPYFKEHCPEMVYYPGDNGWTHCIFVRNDIPPFSDIRVRHACMLAIDHQAIMDRYQGTALLHTWPEQEWCTPVYTPFDELPAETQALYGYDPERALELLEEAGYPVGFETQLTVTGTWADDLESCQIVQSYLADVGIDIELQPVDPGAFGGVLYGRNYEHMISSWWSNDFPSDAMFWAEGGAKNSPHNFGRVVDDQAYELGLQLGCMLDDEEVFALIKEDDVRRLGMMYQILLPTPVGGYFEWPWIKGGYGVGNLGTVNDDGAAEMGKFLWVDKALKDDMGY